MTEKTVPNVASISIHEHDAVEKKNPWSPGILARAPWLGLLGMVGAIAVIAVGVVILVLSNDKPIQDWSVQPSVYLSIISAAAGILFRVGFTSALNVVWWRRAMKENTTIAELHQNWEYGSSLFAAVTSGKNVNLIALAAILAALVPVQAPLFQKASTVQSRRYTEMRDLKVNIAKTIPDGYTGYLSTRSFVPSLLSPPFANIAKDFNQNSLIYLPGSGCKGRCKLRVLGAGFVSNFTNSNVPFHLTDSTSDVSIGTADTSTSSTDDISNSTSSSSNSTDGSANLRKRTTRIKGRATDSVNGPSNSTDGSSNSTDGASQGADDPTKSTAIFSTKFRWPSFDEDLTSLDVMTMGTFNLDVQYKGSAECNGNLVKRSYTFKPAIVSYPVIIDGQQNSISLDSDTTMNDDKLDHVMDLPRIDVANTSPSFNTSTYGGLFLSLSNTYNSEFNVSFGGAIGNQFINKGALSNEYLNSTEDVHKHSCSMMFNDPTDRIIAAVRELMFRTALASTDESQMDNIKYLKAMDENDIPVYKSSWLYIGLAIMVFMLGWIGTVPVFFGWWHLGRAVTMSPVEIGKAFGAPSLDTGNSNAEVKTLLEEVGKRKVQYGAVTSEAAGEDHARLLIGETNLVREPDPGKEFVG